MKYIFPVLILFFLSCNENNKSEEEKGQIKVVRKYCKYEFRDGFFKPEYKLFKNDTEIKILEIENGIINDLSYGDYFIEYKTIFNQKNIIKFSISKSEIKKVILCYDFLDYESNKNVLLLDEIESGQSLKLYFESLGCFDSHSDKIKISKTENNLILEYNGAEHILTNPQIKLLKEFEMELRSNHSAGCSRTDEYGIINEQTRQLYVVTDRSCQWRGFETLIKLLGLKKITT